jgi:hypothetical protein
MRKVVLTVTFDIDQDSQLLQWAFTADGKPITGQGVETGLLAFECKDQLSLVVVANSKKETLNQVTIEGCHLITTPRAFTKRQNPERAGEFAEPSPFGPCGAVVAFGTGTIEGSGTQATWQPDVSFDCSHLGRWEMSFIMTTSISRTDDASGSPERRVFGFDPECEVGMGT